MRNWSLRHSGMARVNDGSHGWTGHPHVYLRVEPGIYRVQALADISRSGYAVIARKPMHRLQTRPVTQLEATAYHFPKLHPGPCSSVGMRRGADTQTDRQTDTQTRVTYIHFASSIRFMRNVMNHACLYSAASKRHRALACTHFPSRSG